MKEETKKYLNLLKILSVDMIDAAGAGYPGISDPGAIIVKHCIENDIPVLLTAFLSESFVTTPSDFLPVERSLLIYFENSWIELAGSTKITGNISFSRRI